MPSVRNGASGRPEALGRIYRHVAPPPSDLSVFTSTKPRPFRGTTRIYRFAGVETSCRVVLPSERRDRVPSIWRHRTARFFSFGTNLPRQPFEHCNPGMTIRHRRISSGSSATTYLPLVEATATPPEEEVGIAKGAKAEARGQRRVSSRRRVSKSRWSSSSRLQTRIRMSS